MEFVTGKVKQYKREYIRTLKTGKSKKYSTEQYTITISKQDNIFEDNQKVMILPESYKEQLVNWDESNQALETNNIELKAKNKNLINTIEKHRSTIKDQEIKINDLSSESHIIKDRIKELEGLKNDERLERFDKLQNDHDRLRNKHDHLQERLRTALEEINQQQKVITDLSNRSFTDYLFGRKPKSLELLEGINSQKKPKIPDIK